MKFLATFLLSVTLVAPVWGQATNSADVNGSVTDASGGVIPGVTITVQDLDKNTERSLTTNSSGLYDTGPLVPADRYILLFKKEGFTSVQRGPMTLSAGVIGLNIQMTVGQSTQQIVVEDAAGPLLETTTAEISSTVPQETLAVLPQTGGTPDWQSILTFLPGTRGNGSNNASAGMGGVSVNGSMPFSNALMDGASTSSPMSNNVINTPIFDTIAEVKMSDSLFSAQYGTGGILYNQISKGGSNGYHGMAYDYFKNTALNAAPFGFNGTAGRNAPIHFNDFGGNIGGPLIKNKIFAFFAMETILSHSTGAVSLISVPTLAMRSGDFSGLNPIYNPATQTVDPATNVVTRQPFLNNQIPASTFDTVAKNIQSYFPLPNRTGNVVNGVTTNNYAYQFPSRNPPKRKYFGRFDADVTSNNRITGSASWNDGPSIGTGPVCPLNCTNSDIFNTTNQLSDYWTITPHMINEARIGFMGEYDLITPNTLGLGYPAKLGLAFAKADVFPAISITNIYGLGPGSPSFANYKENNIDISDQITLIKGRHILHFGGEALIFRADSTAWGNTNSANLGFTGVYTAGSNAGALASTSGVAYADFLLGQAKSWSASVSPEYGGRLKNPGIFVQDDFKVTPKLTLNLGLRWEGNTGWSEVHGNQRGFDANVVNPATNTPGAMWYATTKANGRASLQQPVWNTWMPRFGFAYQLGTKTTVRGGFGLYTYPWNVDTYGGGLGSAFSTSGNQTDSTNNVQPVVILSSDGNTNYQGAKGSSINGLFKSSPTTADAYNGQNVGFVQYTSPVPILKSWNLTVQRQVSSSMVAELAYIGSHGSHLAFTTDLNQVPENKLGPNDAGSRPYPQFQSVTGYTTEGISSYHALQGQLSRRLSRGLMFNVNYTWSHMLSNQDSSGWGSLQGATPYQRAHDSLLNYGNSNFDVRQMFKGHVSYDLPVGKGRQFVNSSKVLDAVIGGWQLFGDFIAQSGSPFTPTMATNNSYSLSSNASWFPNVVGDPRAVPGGQNINSWYNVSAFAAPTPGTFGNMGRNAVVGPRLTAVNTSLHKIFSFTERVKLDFSANATNVLNHPSFALPDRTIGPGHFGQITGTSVGSRQMELVAKLRF
ncbi:MAG: TonB-dependent receptor [Terriglobia bacterium]